MSGTGIWGETYVVVGCLHDSSFNGRKVICCNAEFTFNYQRQLWEAWFSTLDNSMPVILSPDEIMYEEQYMEYIRNNSIYM
ncbi:hypothetical protein D3C87_574290 [compost metagenome]